MPKTHGYQNMTYAQIRLLSEREQRRAYSELRDIAVKRIARGGGYRGQRGQHIETLKELDIMEMDVTAELRKLHTFVKNPATKVSVQKRYYQNQAEKASDTLRAHGYDIAPEDMKGFGTFMEDMRQRAQTRGKSYRGSDRWAELYEHAKRLQISTEDLNKHYRSYINNVEKLENVETPPTGSGYTYNQIRARWNKKRN